MILVDTSVWIDHFRRGNRRLMDLLLSEQVFCHAMVIGELACEQMKDRQGTLFLLNNLRKVPAVSDSQTILFIERQCLYGRGLGFIDVHLLAACCLAKVRLWTLDRRLVSVAQDLGINYSGSVR